MSTNNAVSAQGSTLGVATTAQLPTYTLIAQLTDYTDSTGTATKLDASNLSSTDKTYIAGLRDHGAVTLKGQYVPTDPGQALLKANVGNNVFLHFKSTLPGGLVNTWDAQVAEFMVTPGTDKLLDFSCVIWPTNYVGG